MRLGPARLTHCMRWLGWSKRCMEIAQEYVNRREGFGVKLADRESVQMKLGEVGHNIQIGRLLTMHAAWKLDQGDFARKEVSMAKVHVRQHAAPGRRRRDPAPGRARLFQGHHRSNGSTAPPAPRAWSTAPTRCTRWCWRSSCARKAATSGAGARATGSNPSTASSATRLPLGCGCRAAASARRRWPRSPSTRCSGRMMQVQTRPSGLNSSLPSPSALTVTRSSTKQPKPFLAGGVTGGPPLSRQVRRRSRSPASRRLAAPSRC